MLYKEQRKLNKKIITVTNKLLTKIRTRFEQTRGVAYWLAKFRNALRGHSELRPVQRQMVPVRHLATRVLLGSLPFYLVDPTQHNQ